MTTLLGILADGLEAAAELRSRARLEVLARVRQEMAEFPAILLEDDALPVHKQALRPRVRLFPLGDYRYVWLEPMKGRTTLHMGSDGNLYEYGPEFVRSSDLPTPITDNPMKVRVISPEKLTLAELQECCSLLRSIWI